MLKILAHLIIFKKRIRDAKWNESRSQQNNNEGAADYFRREVDRLRGVSKYISDQITVDRGVQAKIAKTISRRMWANLRNGKPVLIRNKDGSSRTAYSLIGVSRADIMRSVWDKKNNRLYAQLQGIPSDDYLQLQAYYEVLAPRVGMGLDPENFIPQVRKDWQNDIYATRKMIKDEWGDFFSDRSPSYYDGQYISNKIQQRLYDLYMKWENMPSTPGSLGRAIILSSTMPRLDFETMTYNNGRFGIGFKNNVTGEGKYISAALRFLATNEAVAGGKDTVKNIAKEFGIKYRTMREPAKDNSLGDYLGTVITGKDRALVERALKAGQSIDTESPTDFGGLLDTYFGGGQEGTPLNNDEIMNLITLHPNMAKSLGLTGNVALDYISLKIPQENMGLAGSLKALINMDFIPSRALTNRGILTRVSGLNQFYRLSENRARMFFGDVKDGRSVITGDKVPMMKEIYGSENRPDIYTERDQLHFVADRHLEKENANKEGKVC